MTAPVTVVATPATRALARRMARAVLTGEAAGDTALGHVRDVHPRQSLALVVALLNEIRDTATTPRALEAGLLAAWESRIGIEAPVREHIAAFATHLLETGVTCAKRDETAELPALACRACSKDFPRLEARHLCKRCYVKHQNAGTLDRFPLMRRKPLEEAI